MTTMPSPPVPSACLLGTLVPRPGALLLILRRLSGSFSRLSSRHSTMRLFGPSLLLLEYLAFSESTSWNFKHPGTLYSWEGACVWIPCSYINPTGLLNLDKFILFHNYVYNNVTRNFTGTILYEQEKAALLGKRVQFFGNKNNCSLKIQPVYVNDSGQLGLRMVSGSEKWMEGINLTVSEKPLSPRIQLPEEMQEMKEATLTCSLNFACPGYKAELQWSREEQAVTSISLDVKRLSTQSRLTFKPQWTDNGKNVTCQLKGPNQTVLSQETVQLNVKYLPRVEIEKSPSEAAVINGRAVTIACRVLGSNPEYQRIAWFKDHTHLSEQEKDTLTLSNVTKNDSGKYHCQVSNDLGSKDSEAVDLQVQFAPEPSNVQIIPLPAKEGQRVTLTCVSPAYPPPTNYTWYYNGKEAQGRTEKDFQISNISLSHSGSYACVAQNSIGPGQVGQRAKLDVQYPPKGVTTLIQNPTPIREGDDVTLVCHYSSSNPSVTGYKWKPQASKNESFPEVMMIRKIPWDAQSVSCQACNRWCSESPSIKLDVHYAPRDVKVQKIHPKTEIHSGSSVTLQCSYSSSHPKDVHYSWKKNGSFLKAQQELMFDSISPEDAGSYSCLINNSIGQTASNTWMLEVLYAPRALRVTIVPQDRVMEGREAVLTCESDANPPVEKYTWFDWKNQKIHDASQMLRLAPTKIEHSGAYRCQGTNRLGEGESPPSTLTVYYSPATIGKRAAVGLGACLSVLILAIWAVKLHRSWKIIRDQQGLQENSSGQSFFVRNNKVRRAYLSERPHSLGCHNPAMEDSVSYAALRFPAGETDSPDAGGMRSSASTPDMEDMVTYSVVQKHRVGDYENVAPTPPEDEEGVHYSELVHFRIGERPPAQEGVEYVTVKPCGAEPVPAEVSKGCRGKAVPDLP